MNNEFRIQKSEVRSECVILRSPFPAERLRQQNVRHAQDSYFCNGDLSNSPKIFRRLRRGFIPNYFDKLSVKLLQHFNKQNNNRGFTLIELLVVIIIIGILSAIALPSFLNQVNKAKEAEPRMTINGANKTQSGYYIENSQFTGDLGILELPNETDNYTYQIQNFVPELSLIRATPKNPTLRYFLGITYLENDGTLYQRVCKASQQDFLLNILPKFLDFKLDKNEINELDSKYCGSK